MPESFENVKPSSAMLSLGSNQGDRMGHLEFAVASLARHPEIKIVGVSSVYETTAHVLNPDESQRDYLNAAIHIITSMNPHQLLSACLEIESSRGRKRSPRLRWAPRILDIDILTYGAQRSNDASLTLPHPRLAERRFVLQPLFEIAPDLEIPAPFDRSVQYLLEHCADVASVERYSEMLAAPGKNDKR